MNDYERHILINFIDPNEEFEFFVHRAGMPVYPGCISPVSYKKKGTELKTSEIELIIAERKNTLFKKEHFVELNSLSTEGWKMDIESQGSKNLSKDSNSK